METDSDNSQLIVLIINSIVSVFTLLISAHTSYKSKHCQSKCCGNEFSFDSEKTA